VSSVDAPHWGECMWDATGTVLGEACAASVPASQSRCTAMLAASCIRSCSCCSCFHKVGQGSGPDTDDTSTSSGEAERGTRGTERMLRYSALAVEPRVNGKRRCWDCCCCLSLLRLRCVERNAAIQRRDQLRGLVAQCRRL